MVCKTQTGDQAIARHEAITTGGAFEAQRFGKVMDVQVPHVQFRTLHGQDVVVGLTQIIRDTPQPPGRRHLVGHLAYHHPAGKVGEHRVDDLPGDACHPARGCIEGEYPHDDPVPSPTALGAQGIRDPVALAGGAIPH